MKLKKILLSLAAFFVIGGTLAPTTVQSETLASRRTHYYRSSSSQGTLKKSTPSEQLARSVLTPTVVKQLGGEQNIKWNQHGALQDLGVYLVYDALSWFGFPGEVNYYPVKLRNGIDGSGTAILSYEDFEVVLNIGKTANSYLPGEIYGEKETLLLDNAAELKKVELVDGAGNVTILSVEPEEQNPMIAEAKAFAKLLRDPGSLENKQIQQDWLALAVEVNQVLYELRKSAQIVFKADREF